jgi:hypothetical protein
LSTNLNSIFKGFELKSTPFFATQASTDLANEYTGS